MTRNRSTRAGSRQLRGPLPWLLVVATVGFVPAAVTGETSAPSNDDYADAAVVGVLPFADTRDIGGATAEPLETVGSCNNPPVLLPNPVFPSVWYRF
ncbi:MAG: hypothetical protein KY469_08850, partial [Actinobacteria bacterium]|nr:hypothetical protein [Actinomycetota bacterium]